jgi:transposase-like protein
VTKTQVEVITSVERRRRWSSAEKERLVAASLEPGAVVSALAREAGLHPSSCTNGGTSCVRSKKQHEDLLRCRSSANRRRPDGRRRLA